jgi:hypothetical protein
LKTGFVVDEKGTPACNNADRNRESDLSQTHLEKEIKMFTNRLFLSVGLAVILVVVGFAVQQAFATQANASQPRLAYVEAEARALREYWLGERYGQTPAILSPVEGMEQYHQSERTFVDPQAGMAIYHTSERTRIPVRFTRYQLSEWFGK